MTDTLMVSVSGVRGIVGKDLTPDLVARYAAAFGVIAGETGRPLVILARDARTSGPMFAAAAQAGLQSVGCRVIDLGVAPTPTAQLAVEHHQAGGGVVLTASHNPVEWNALKFVGPDGVFLDVATGQRLRDLAERSIPRVSWDRVGAVGHDDDAIRRHIALVLQLPYVDLDAIRRRQFTVALDCVRGAGGTIMPALLEALGCTVHGMDLEPDGRFPRPPEPVPAHLEGLGKLVRRTGAQVGFAVDPDVDRLAVVDETGCAVGEDYTVAFGVETVLRRTPGPVVVNLSTSLVVDDVARRFSARMNRAPVGEANVARAMQRSEAVVGGEGNGGIMLPALHFGRDAPLAAALILDLLAADDQSVGSRVAGRPRYVIVKAKADRGPEMARIASALTRRFRDAEVDWQDGIRLAWSDRWLHVRPSGTEPILRLIAEGPDVTVAEELVDTARRALGAK